MKDCAQRALSIYVSLMVHQGFSRRNTDEGFWSNTVRSIQAQWGLAKNLSHATGAFISPGTVQIIEAEAVRELVGVNV